MSEVFLTLQTTELTRSVNSETAAMMFLLVKFSLVQFKDLHLYGLSIINERLCVFNKPYAVLVSWKLTYLVKAIFYELGILACFQRLFPKMEMLQSHVLAIENDLQLN